MANNISGLSLSATRAAVPGKMETVATPQPQDRVGSSAEPKSGHSMAAKLGLLAMGGLAVAGGLGVMATPAQAETVLYQCQADPYQMQDEALLGHLGTLFASPVSGYNRAAGLYDADGGIFAQANELTRLDGHQALKQLSCGHPVRLYSPQTGWLKFHTLDQLHGYVGTYGQPWDQPNVYLGSQYVAGYGSPWYDSDYYQYNDYNADSNFYGGLTDPDWNYVAPPTYTPPSTWNQAPLDGNWNQAPPGGWNQAPPDGSSWNQTPPTQAPGWNQAPPAQAPSWNQAPPAQAPGWNQAPPTQAPGWNQAPPTQAPPAQAPSWNQTPTQAPSWNQAPSSAPSWNQTPAAVPGNNWNQAPAASPSNNNWNQAPASRGGSWNQAPASSPGSNGAPADWN